MSLTGRALVFSLVAVACVSACDKAPPPKAATQAGDAKPKKLEANLPAKFVAAVSAGKSASMISVHFSLEAPPSVGKPLPVEIAIVPHRAFSSVQAGFESPQAMILATGARFEAQKDVKPEVVLSHKLVLQPNQEGVYLITAAVETEGDEGSVIRIYSIPVIVHGAIPESPGKPVANPRAKPAQG